MRVHVTVNNYIFVGLRGGKIYRSSDGGYNFTEVYEWKNNGHCHTWSIASDEKWILIGEYGRKIVPRRVIASKDWGDHWEIVYETPELEVVHIHRVTIDPYTDNWWITVGDYPVAGRVMYSSDHGVNWNEVGCPETGRAWQPYQPINILFFETFILIVNEPTPQVFKVDRKTMTAKYIADIDIPHALLAAPYSVVVGYYGIYASIIRQQNNHHSAGIFVSYDQGYTWTQLINFTIWAVQENPSIDPSNVYGANPIIYADGWVHATWISYPWVGTDENFVFEGGKAFKFKDAPYSPIIENSDGYEETNTTSMTPTYTMEVTKSPVVSSSTEETITTPMTAPIAEETSTTHLTTTPGTKEAIIPEFSVSLIQPMIVELLTIISIPVIRRFKTSQKEKAELSFSIKQAL